jgi:membrane associated rhomboid family serine protease
MVTVLILSANLLVFLYELTLGPRHLDWLVNAYGTIPVEILSGRDIPPPIPVPVTLTLVTSTFIHGGFLHIASNMLYLWVFGDNVEDVMGKPTFLAFYLACGVVGGLAHVVTNAASAIPTVGASGAVAGILGAYLVIFPKATVRTLLLIGPFITITRISAVLLIAFWFVTQLVLGLMSLSVATETTTGVAFWAHIGGFVAGFILGLMLRPRGSHRWRDAW